jgi:hypothetical protein
MKNNNTNIRVDFRLWNYLRLQPANEKAGYWNSIQLDSFNGVFPIRNIYFHRYFFVEESILDFNLSQNNLSQFYDSGDIQLLDHIQK